MKARWFIRGDGKVYGPLDDMRLRSLVAEGKIDESTEVAVDARGPWHAAGRVRGLFATSATNQGGSSNAAHSEEGGEVTPSQSSGWGYSEAAISNLPKDHLLHPANRRKGSREVLRLLGRGVLVFAGVIGSVALVAFLVLNFYRSQVQGSVFIVQANGQSVRLALAEVFVIPSEAVTSDAMAGVQDALRKLRAAEASVARVGADPDLVRRINAMGGKREALADFDAAVSPLLARAVDSVKTDPEGNFEVALPLHPPTVLVSYASRKIAFDSEHYFWIVPRGEAVRQSPRLFLSNDNQFR
jgi:hypothetical protein